MASKEDVAYCKPFFVLGVFVCGLHRGMERAVDECKLAHVGASAHFAF